MECKFKVIVSHSWVFAFNLNLVKFKTQKWIFVRSGIDLGC